MTLEYRERTVEKLNRHRDIDKICRKGKISIKMYSTDFLTTRVYEEQQ